MSKYYLEHKGEDYIFLCTDGGLCDDLDHAKGFDSGDAAKKHAENEMQHPTEWVVYEDTSEGW